MAHSITWTRATGRTWRVTISGDAAADRDARALRTVQLLGFRDFADMPPQMVALARRGFLASRIAERMLAPESVVHRLRRIGA
jgi:hypothetical protein